MFFSPKSTAQETVLGTSIALNSTVNVADGYMTCGFTSFSAVLHIRTTAGVGGGGSGGRWVIKGCVLWNLTFYNDFRRLQPEPNPEPQAPAIV